MCRKRQISVFVVCLVMTFVIGSASSLGQEREEQLEKAQDLVEELKETESTDRGPIMEDIEDLGTAAVQPLTEVVEEWKAQDDPGFVSCCMIVLGRLGPSAEPATEPLMQALQSRLAHIRYSAAKALGEIWKPPEEDDEAEQDREPSKDLNGALAAALYSAVYRQGEAEVYGPARALVKINKIPIDKGRHAKAISVPAENLWRQVHAWIEGNNDAIPDLEDQPWSLLLAHIFGQGDSSEEDVGEEDLEKAEEIKKILIRRQPFSSIQSIIELCENSEIQKEEWRWEQLADILEGMTDVEMPSDSDKTAVELVRDWETRWLQSLKEREDEKYRQYTLNQLDALIAQAQERPASEVLEKIDTMKEIILQQLDSPEQLPANISPDARSLLEVPLEIKAELRDVIDALKEHEEAHRRLQNMKSVQRLVSMESGPLVARQYLEELVGVARDEQRVQILAAIGRVLRDVTGVPVVLTELDREEKSERLEELMGQVEGDNGQENGDEE